VDDIGWSELEVRAGLSRSFGRDLERDATRASGRAGTSAGTHLGSTMGKRATSTMHHHFTDAAKYVVGPLVAAFTVEKIGEVVGESISLASDLAESQNKVQQVFGKSAGSVFRFTSGADRRIGQTNQQARDAAATFGIFGHAADLNDRKSAKFSIRMTTLASDLASFHNTSPEQAIEALGAALRGETEPIRAYGVLLNQTSLKAEAVRIGLLKTAQDKGKIQSAQAAVLADQKAYNKALEDSGKGSLAAFTAHGHLLVAQSALSNAVKGTIPPLTQQQQVLAAQSLIFQQTKVAQGDFERTSGGLANQQRILSATWKDSEAALGKGLLPVVTDFVKFTNRELIPAVADGAHWFDHKGAPALRHFTHEAAPLVKQTLPALHDGLKATSDVVGHLAPHVASIINSFTKLPKPLQEALIAGAGAAYIGKKTGLLGAGVKAVEHAAAGGASSFLHKGSSPANPLFVWTVNGGKGGGVPDAPESFVKKWLKRVAPDAAAAEGGLALTAPEIASMAALFAGGTVAQGVLTHHELTTAQRLALSRSTGNYGHFGGPDNPKLARETARRFTQLSIQTNGPVWNPHLKATGTTVDALNASLQRTSRDLELIRNAGGRSFGDLVKSGGEYKSLLAHLPARVQTQVLTPGLIKSQADIERLDRRFDLTPKQLSTLYKLEGIQKARADFDALQGHMGQHRSFTETIELASHAAPGINVQGDLHIHGDERTRQEQTRRNRQRANSDGVRRGSP
jgi:hypothetical protein